MKEKSNAILHELDNQIKKSADQYMKDVIIPFCKKHKLKFYSNTWSFYHPLAGGFNGYIAKQYVNGDNNHDRIKFFASMGLVEHANFVEDIFTIENGLWSFNKHQYFYNVDFTEQ